MTRIRTLFTPVLFLTVWAPALPAQGARGASDPGAQVDRIFARWNTPHSPGCAVGVARDGQTILARGYGMAELEHDVPITPATVFEAGSVSKQFTAAAVVLLANDGKLSLDDDVRKYVPELPDYGEPITIRQMLNHTSGLRDWGVVASIAGWPRGSRVHTHAHVLEILKRQRALNFPPGTEYSYSNSGYNLLAVIVDRLSGQPFAQFTKQRVFEPLGLASTGWRDDHTRIVKGRATAYRPAGDGFRIEMPFENVHGNGGLLTTVGDLLAWNENFVHGRLGGRAFAGDLQRRGRLDSGRQIAYALGVVAGEHNGVPEVSHTGATAGYRAFLGRYPEQRLSVALLCNVGNVNPGNVGREVADVFLGGAARAIAVKATRIALSARDLAARAGMYRSLRTHEPLRLSAGEGTLRLGELELVPLSTTEFQLGSRSARIVFDRPAAGAPAGFRLIDSDGDTIAHEPVAEARPTGDQMAAYAGEYHSDEAEATYTVAYADGKLVLRRRPDVSIELTPAYADAFTSPLGLVRFIRDAGGGVREMSLGLGRVRDIRFARSSAGSH